MNYLKNALNEQESTSFDNVTKETKEYKSPNILKKLKNKLSNLTTKQKVAIFGTFSAFTFFSLLVLAIVFKLDSYIFPSSVSGVVTNEQRERVEGAKVCAQAQCTKTAPNGSYVLRNLTRGDITMTVESEDYKKHLQTLTVSRGRTNVNLSLVYRGYGTIKGSLAAVDEKADLYSVKISLDGEEIEPSEEGIFVFEKVPFGEQTLYIDSPRYKDEQVTIELDSYEYNLGEIVLTSSGMIEIQVVNWVNNNKIKDVKVEASKDSRKTSDKGIVNFEDLDTQKLEFSLSKSGYISKTLKINIEQGINESKKVSLVPNGKLVYLSNRLGNKNIYMSNYDGSGEVLLTDNKGDSNAPFLSDDQQTVYFLSDRDKVKSNTSYPIILAYKVDVNTKQITKVTKLNYELHESIGRYSFESMKRAFYVRDFSKRTSDIWLGDIDGTNTEKIATYDGYVNNLTLSPSGKYLVYSVTGTDEKPGLYLYNNETGKASFIIKNEENRTFYPLDISNNDNLILMKLFDRDYSRWDLVVYNIKNKSEIILTNSSAEENSARFLLDDNGISFTSERDGKTDVYIINLDGTSEEKITEGQDVEDYYFKNNLLFYKAENALWVKDPTASSKAKKITSDVFTSYYGLYYGYYN